MITKNNNSKRIDKNMVIEEEEYDVGDESLMNNSTIQRQRKFSSDVTTRLNNIISNLSSRTQTSSTSVSSDNNDELGSALSTTQEQRRLVDYDFNNDNNQVLRDDQVFRTDSYNVRDDQVFRTDSYNVVHVGDTNITDEELPYNYSESATSAPDDNITISSSHLCHANNNVLQHGTKNINDEHYIPSNVIEKLNRLVVSNKQSALMQQKQNSNPKPKHVVRYVTQRKKSSCRTSTTVSNSRNVLISII